MPSFYTRQASNKNTISSSKGSLTEVYNMIGFTNRYPRYVCLLHLLFPPRKRKIAKTFIAFLSLFISRIHSTLIYSLYFSPRRKRECAKLLTAFLLAFISLSIVS
jgi:hypothetical protein